VNPSDARRKVEYATVVAKNLDTKPNNYQGGWKTVVSGPKDVAIGNSMPKLIGNGSVKVAATKGNKRKRRRNKSKRKLARDGGSHVNMDGIGGEQPVAVIAERYELSQWAKSPKKQSEGVRFRRRNYFFAIYKIVNAKINSIVFGH